LLRNRSLVQQQFEFVLRLIELLPQDCEILTDREEFALSHLSCRKNLHCARNQQIVLRCQLA
jgi:hypothetical protein